MSRLFNILLISLTIYSGSKINLSNAQEKTVNVYTYREPQLITPLFEKFTNETGIRVNTFFAKDGLEQKIKAEGKSTQADLLITTDISRLSEAVDLGIAQSYKSELLTTRIPEKFRDPNGYWYALSMRARVLYVDKNISDLSNINYEELSSVRFKGMICSRSGQHIYNNALFSAAVIHMGEAAAEEWLLGIKNNLVGRPSGGDRDVARDIAAGRCKIGLGNTYYVGLMLENSDQKAWADAIKVVMPKFKNGGTHVNISGALITLNAPNRTNAIRLLEWLTGRDAQMIYASTNYEYPVVSDVELNFLLKSWGALTIDTIPLSKISANKRKAVELIDRTRFDDGP